MRPSGESTPPRFYCPVAMRPGEALALPDELARHAMRALRLRIGAPLVLFDGTGGEYRATLVRDRAPASVRIDGFDPVERESPLPVTLVQGIATAERMDFIVQKAVELGVAAIEPVFTSRSITRLDAERATRRREHWQRVVVAACEQCGRNRIAPVSPLMAFEDWLRGLRADAAGTASSEASPVRRIVLTTRGSVAFASAIGSAVERAPLTLLAGPEGGFSDDETRVAARHGFVAAKLGPRVLRTETAALAALAVIQATAGDLR